MYLGFFVYEAVTSTTCKKYRWIRVLHCATYDQAKGFFVHKKTHQKPLKGIFGGSYWVLIRLIKIQQLMAK